jgi:predicted ribosome quality control (RQC) complex YloA/Tae2 family protein
MWSLVLTTAHATLGLYFAPYSPKQRQHRATLFSELNDLQILNIALSATERLIFFHLENKLTLCFQLYSADTNCFVLNEQQIIKSFKHQDKWVKQSLKAQNTTPIITHLEKLANDKAFFDDAYQDAMLSSPEEQINALLPGFDRGLKKTFLKRVAARQKDHNKKESYYTVLQDLFYELIDPQPAVYFPLNKSPYFSILAQPPGLSEDRQTFESINEAIRHFSRLIYQQDNIGSDVTRFKKLIEKIIQKKQKQIQEMGTGLKTDRSLQYEHFGQLILANAYQIEKGMQTITANDFNTNEPVELKLDPFKTPHENADSFFLKAKKQRLKSQALSERLEETQKSLEGCQAMIQGLESVSQSKALKAWKNEWKELLKANGLLSKDELGRQSLFRTVTLSENAELWIGKNAKNNQLLTFRHTRPNDIWLHARGVSGSHCVIKAKGICSKADIEQAAEIAAYYSGAKTSEFVPVIVTPKKYVRQKKGAPPGTVSVMKEDVLIVKPARLRGGD